ncbi:ArsR/SmtB family transcription factor [Lactiplantibacillus mudanjiangensis]|uniref:ArsR family transcriptional regulator [Lactobacillus plantarum] n=1 Tax=Lactiplantibacillus mudanjiangensis TaxID=1296538 RepID=A0A660E616_9LACO|nr:metalloregulator ArsR/SmtB family transcription factor [Lactiplantibacillus mudanjiangensis]VDG20226.1 ArsR family transcriptional regulator [Lactobacillus plantarum] [Lactiplantibacillus mudanjiangensis]VDG24079.1 ArsR family transcriptional regulator [Lactobacillus plantarum] [Lactiplantibacillus mudanjiangensis]VDG30259.1 ArsR family transcriptional regulator [Lactobacillus plantarum] [Lactiplantibacillus mudanjiangensis]VDG33820.1 ArsR family transcriptional regulator [Lactobacillus plan
MEVNDAILAEAVKIYKVLSNVNRIKILYFLENHEADVSSIVAHVNLPQPMVSHQLAILYEYQLVTRSKQGKHVYYCLDDPHILEMVNAMLGHVAHEIKHEPHHD